MEAVYHSGKAKAIGVSNWGVPYLEHLKKMWTVTPVANQSVTASRIEQNLKVVQLSKEDMGVFNGLAASGKQKRSILRPGVMIWELRTGMGGCRISREPGVLISPLGSRKNFVSVIVCTILEPLLEEGSRGCGVASSEMVA
ncbi:NADP-dependent oxidoreductase domain protein [Metarhizium guizhouense ARSEF 977]|uniref:NADP-dependent oxidoreductase domain protein n=1 Tax=Metarhizium guizhouense (strain ARSEF 977) TaxID=1276136 RepID=A0A0B4HWN6_METGA|nr:NADP-dependent oxidoreductase domain protein [Metarhizium guizhouense ARSEF 977]